MFLLGSNDEVRFVLDFYIYINSLKNVLEKRVKYLFPSQDAVCFGHPNILIEISIICIKHETSDGEELDVICQMVISWFFLCVINGSDFS